MTDFEDIIRDGTHRWPTPPDGDINHWAVRHWTKHAAIREQTFNQIDRLNQEAKDLKRICRHCALKRYRAKGILISQCLCRAWLIAVGNRRWDPISTRERSDRPRWHIRFDQLTPEAQQLVRWDSVAWSRKEGHHLWMPGLPGRVA